MEGRERFPAPCFWPSPCSPASRLLVRISALSVWTRLVRRLPMVAGAASKEMVAKAAKGQPVTVWRRGRCSGGARGRWALVALPELRRYLQHWQASGGAEESDEARPLSNTVLSQTPRRNPGRCLCQHGIGKRRIVRSETVVHQGYRAGPGAFLHAPGDPLELNQPEL